MSTPPGSGESLGETEAALILAGEDILSQDNVPDENQQLTCFSCGEALTGLYCHACGQKNDDYRRSIFSLVAETFASFFSLDNRMWRTWAKLLLKPGKVARDFADGKRTSWTSPVRMYLALSIILFGYMSLTETRIFSIRTDIVPKAGFEGPIEGLADSSIDLEADFGFFRRQAQIDKLNSKVDLNRASKLLLGTPRQVFVFDKNLNVLGITPSDELLIASQSWPEPSNGEGNVIDEQAARETALNTYLTRIEEAVETYNQILGFRVNQELLSDRLFDSKENEEEFDLVSELSLSETENIKEIANKTLPALDNELSLLGLSRKNLNALPTESRTDFELDFGEGQINGVKVSNSDAHNLAEQVLRNPAILNESLSKYLPRIMFLMMPFAALIGLIFIRGKTTALLYDHLVHATYIHAVTFAFLLVLILLAQWTPMIGLAQIFLIGIAIYLPLSAKGMFGRRWFKTIFASYGIAFIYAVVMVLVVIFLTADSIVQTFEAENA